MPSLVLLGRPSKLIQLSARLLRNLPLQPTQLRRQRTTKAKAPPKTYNTPHPPKDPPENYQPTSLNHNAFTAPPFLPCAVFRPFACPDEPLGPAASKCGHYKNPEYFAYHRYTFVELQRNSLELRQQRICCENPTCITDSEVEQEQQPAEEVEEIGGSADGSSSESGSGSSGDSSSSDDEPSCPSGDSKEPKETPSDDKPSDILI